MAEVLEEKRLRPRTADQPEDEFDATPIERRRSTRKKLTIEVSADLHRRILTICSTRHVPVNQAVREVLDKAFPGS